MQHNTTTTASNSLALNSSETVNSNSTTTMQTDSTTSTTWPLRQPTTDNLPALKRMHALLAGAVQKFEAMKEGGRKAHGLTPSSFDRLSWAVEHVARRAKDVSGWIERGGELTVLQLNEFRDAAGIRMYEGRAYCTDLMRVQTHRLTRDARHAVESAASKLLNREEANKLASLTTELKTTVDAYTERATVLEALARDIFTEDRRPCPGELGRTAAKYLREMLERAARETERAASTGKPLHSIESAARTWRDVLHTFEQCNALATLACTRDMDHLREANYGRPFDLTTWQKYRRTFQAWLDKLGELPAHVQPVEA